MFAELHGSIGSGLREKTRARRPRREGEARGENEERTDIRLLYLFSTPHVHLFQQPILYININHPSVFRSRAHPASVLGPVGRVWVLYPRELELRQVE